MDERGRLVGQLRSALANTIAQSKAYDVPALCERLGLASGTEEEAFSSKYRYASKRLQSVRPDRAVDAARLILEETDDFQLTEILSKLEEFEREHVSELTRRRIIELFDGYSLVTEGDHLDFIRRLWPIDETPSPYQDSPFGNSGTLEDAIIQHTVRNDDWSNGELLEHLGLLTCSQRQFFRFLEEVTDPLAQSEERQSQLAEAIDQHLTHDGYRLQVKRRMSGSPVFGVLKQSVGSPSDESISAILEAFNSDVIHERWQAALERRVSNPEGAITLARTLLEDVCKWIIVEAGDDYEEDDDLPSLYRKLSKILNLAPDQHTEKIFKQILGSCQSIVESLGALRNKIGDAHSVGPLRTKPSARHAELAVNLAGTMATFLVSTWRHRQEVEPCEQSRH